MSLRDWNSDNGGEPIDIYFRQFGDSEKRHVVLSGLYYPLEWSLGVSVELTYGEAYEDYETRRAATVSFGPWRFDLTVYRVAK